MSRRLPIVPPGVDEFRREGAVSTDNWTAAAAPEERVPTHCAFCGVQCAMFLRVRDGKVFGVEPREHEINHAKLCPKGVVAYQQVDHPDRLLHPLMRDRHDGPLRRVDWDTALDRVVHEIERIQHTHGPDAFGVISGASLTTEKTYLAGKFARVALGTRHIDYNGRLCMVSAAAANKKSFGIDRAANPWADMLETDVVLIAGANVGECFPVMTQYVWGARDRGAKLITIDPRSTPVGRTADIDVPLRPGTDAAFFNGVLHVIVAEGLTNEEFIADHTTGWGAVRDAVTAYPPSRVGDICGIDPGLVVAVARMWGGAERAMAFHARGIEHHIQGVDNCQSVINLVLATGQLGRPGSGYGTITGQGNGQGGREHGQKADMLPGLRDIENPEHRAHIAAVWGIDEADLPHKGTSFVEMMGQMRAGEIKGVLGLCNNPLVGLPDRNATVAAYDALEFHAQLDFFLSETCVRADVVLPTTTWAEDDGTTTNAQAQVVRIRKAVEPPGEVAPDWWVLCEIARRLGNGDKFSFASPEAIFDELRIASKGGVADYFGITYEKIDAAGCVAWPCPSLDHPGTPRLFEDRRSYFPDGMMRFHAVEWHEPAEPPDDEYPLRLTTGRTVAHYLSGNQTRRIPALVEQTPRPWVEVHPSLGFAPGAPVRVTTRRGSAVYPALVTETIRSDTVFVPYHWPAPTAANILTIDALDPVSKIPEFKVCACRVEAANEVDPVPPPPNPEDREPYPDVVRPLTDPRPPTMSQGRETSR
jgi:assimilatory nitrate reductase catalytic subunit